MLRRVWWVIGGLLLAVWMVVAPTTSGAVLNSLPPLALTTTATPPLPSATPAVPSVTPAVPPVTPVIPPTNTPVDPPTATPATPEPPTATPRPDDDDDDPDPTETPTLTPTATLPPLGDPSVRKSADPSSGLPGDSVTFTIRVRNGGTIPATNVEVNDSVPGVFEITGATTSQGSIEVSGQSVHAVIGTIDPGGEVVIRISTKIRADATPGQVDNVAILSTDTPGDDPGNNTSSVTVEILGPPILPPATLPPTGGTTSWPWALMLLASVALAGGLLLRTRRRAS